MPRRRGARTQARWLVGAGTVVLVLVIVWALLVPGADWLAHHDVGSTGGTALATARDAARGRLLTLGAGLVAAGALLFTARSFVLSREGQVTDRYTKAVEQLGSDKLDVRIGGIYALERVARDSAKDHSTVIEVLTAFIRGHSREQWPQPDADSPVQERSTRPDVQAAVTVVGRREAKRDIGAIDLTRADLTHAILTGATLGGADLTAATLGGADLTGTDLTHANLSAADVSSATFGSAKLTGADLTGADLTGTDLTGATLGSAKLTRADLTSTDLTSTDLTSTDLTDATLDEAVLTGADLTGAKLNRATLTGAKLTRADLTRADLTHADLTDADLGAATLTGATLFRADLTRAKLFGTTLTDADLTGADLTNTDLTNADLTSVVLIRANLGAANLTGVKWPDEVPAPGGWMLDGESSRLKREGPLSELRPRCPSCDPTGHEPQGCGGFPLAVPPETEPLGDSPRGVAAVATATLLQGRRPAEPEGTLRGRMPLSDADF